MNVRQDTNGSLLPAVNAAQRAVVFLTVPWSGPERDARVTFRTAAEQLAIEWRGLSVECFTLDEEADWCQVWLAGLELPQLGGGFPLGAGSMVWLESGRAVWYEIAGCALKPGGVVARARWLWAAGSKSRVALDRDA